MSYYVHTCKRSGCEHCVDTGGIDWVENAAARDQREGGIGWSPDYRSERPDMLLNAKPVTLDPTPFHRTVRHLRTQREQDEARERNALAAWNGERA